MRKAGSILALLCFAALIVGTGLVLRRFPWLAVAMGLGPCVLTLGGAFLTLFK